MHNVKKCVVAKFKNRIEPLSTVLTHKTVFVCRIWGLSKFDHLSLVCEENLQAVKMLALCIFVQCSVVNVFNNLLTSCCNWAVHTVCTPLGMGLTRSVGQYKRNLYMCFSPLPRRQ